MSQPALDERTAKKRPGQTSIGRAALAGVCASMLWGVFDAVACMEAHRSLLRERGLGAIAAVLLVVPIGWVGGTIVGLLEWSARWTWYHMNRSRIRPHLVDRIMGVVVGALGAPVCFTVLGRELEKSPSVSTLLVAVLPAAAAVLCFAGGVIGVPALAWAVDRASKRRLGRVVLAATALGAATVALRVALMPQIEVRPALLLLAHVGGFLAGWAGFRCVLGVPRTQLQRLATAAPGLVAGLYPWLLSNPVSRHVYWENARASRPAAQYLIQESDLDGDGMSGLLGAGDCAEGDGAVHWMAPDPLDGRDTNCDGIDGPPPGAAVVNEPYGAAESEELRRLRANLQHANVVILCVDALRADFQVIGRRPPAALTDLRRASVWFEYAIAPAPATAMSLAATLGGGFEPPPRPSITRDFARAGYTTAFVSVEPAARPIRSTALGAKLPFDVERVLNVEGNNALWGGGITTPTGELIAGEASRLIGELASAGRPFLVWIHLFTTHQWPLLRGQPAALTPHERYAAALSDDDAAVGRILRTLDAFGLGERTVVVLSSDHGEGLFDRGTVTHTAVVDPEIARIPLGMRIPGHLPASIRTVVSLASLLPTLADLVGVPLASRPPLPALTPLLVAGNRAPAGAPYPVISVGAREQLVIYHQQVLELTAGFAYSLYPLSEHASRYHPNWAASHPSAALPLLYLLGRALRPERAPPLPNPLVELLGDGALGRPEDLPRGPHE